MPAAPIPITGATQYDVVTTKDGRTFLYVRLSDGSIWVNIYDAFLVLVQSRQAIAGPVDDKRIDAEEYVAGKGRWLMHIEYTLNNALIDSSSRDGYNFTE